MYTEDELLPISAMSDIVYCERRAALHILERLWNDNIYTTEGSLLHKKVDEEGRVETRGGIRYAYSLRIRSTKIGLIGKADLVEFHKIPKDSGEPDIASVRLPGLRGQWKVVPVEYKRGILRKEAFKLLQGNMI